MAHDDIIVLNEGLGVLERRLSKSGKQRYTVKITAEPIVVNTSKDAIGGPVAEAIAHHLREKIRGISAVASAATLEYRRKAQSAFKRGAPWAVRRYSGGRTGPMEPNQTNRLFNDSGRFGETIFASASKDAWRVNVAANRLSGDPASVQRIYLRLVQFVPELANPSLLLRNDIIRRALQTAADNMIQKGRATSKKMGASLVRSLLRTGRQLAAIGNSLSA
jgi:hypothetical protein